jgi:hypothetical protein
MFLHLGMRLFHIFSWFGLYTIPLICILKSIYEAAHPL